MRICIDPGHSGPVEPGACAAGLTEAAINLAIALQLGDLLYAQGHELIFTRQGEIESDGLAFRADMANQAGADLFLSLHCNAAASSQGRGVETYHYGGSQAGLRLAGAVQFRLAIAGYTRNRGVKEANFAVLRLTAMPAILIECGFLTNPDDRAVLASADGQGRIAACIANGVQDYLAGYPQGGNFISENQHE